MGAIFKETLAEWCNDNVPRLGASLAFYTLLSLAPLLVVIVGVAALVFGEKAAQGQLFWQLQGVVGMERARAMQDLIRGASKPGTGAVATVLSLAMLSLGASSVMVELTETRTSRIVWSETFDHRIDNALLLLEEIGEPYRTELLDFGTTMKAPSYLSINPMGKVPALKHGDAIITEAAAICCYLADAFPKAKLNIPIEDPRRGPYLKWLFFGPSCFEPARALNHASHHQRRHDSSQRIDRTVDRDHGAALRYRRELADHRRAHHIDRSA